MKNTFYLSLFLLFLMACQNDPTSSLSELDLMQYDVPITILAPDSAKVKTMDLLVQKDVTVKGKDGYDLQIFASDATVLDEAQIAAELKAEVKNNPYFTKMVKEDDPNGFIYQTQIDSTTISYNFQLVRIRGDREFIFQNGLGGTFTLEQIEMMYNAVKED